MRASVALLGASSLLRARPPPRLGHQLQGCGSFLLALLLAVVLIGILVFIYMLLVKPEGTLSVTYERQQLVTSAIDSSGGFSGDLEKLADLHQRGVLTDEEFAAKKKQILEM